MGEPVELTSAEQVDDAILEHAIQVAEDWFPERIDWDGYWDRFDTSAFWVGDVLSPAASKIQRHVQRFRREAG